MPSENTILFSITDEDIQRDLLCKVMWGDPPEAILKWLQTQPREEDILMTWYDEAKQQRIDTIRAFYKKRMRNGFILLLIGMTPLWLVFENKEAMDVVRYGGDAVKHLISLLGIMIILGLWRVLDAIGGIVIAAKHIGCVTQMHEDSFEGEKLFATRLEHPYD